jgi:phage repressor protein C with HTH and peptisase S24 domain
MPSAPKRTDDDEGLSTFTPAVGERIAELIRAAGGLAPAGRLAGVTDEQVARWRDGKSKPNLFGIAALASAAGKSVDWVLRGPAADELVVRRPGSDEALEDFRLVPRLNVQAAAGAGAMVADESAAEMLAFRTEWLHRRGINAAAAHVLTARGDSMEPTIRDGDILLVDTSIDRVVDNAIYVVVYSGRTLVKRVQLRLDGSVVLKSDNREIFDDEAVPVAEVPALNIAGRVMWFGRSI